MSENTPHNWRLVRQSSNLKVEIPQFYAWNSEFSKASLFTCGPTGPGGGRVIGFDSFQGLSEDWIGTGLAKGQFDLGGKMPSVPANVELVRGWVEETLPNFLRENPLDQVSLVHMDLDTYSPTLTVLSALNSRLEPGTLILFDEYFGYWGWENHEHRALLESGLRFEYLAYSTNDIGLGSENVLIRTL